MTYKSTIVLLVLFFAGLGVLLWAEYAKVPTEEQRRAMLQRVLPDLVDVPVNDVRRLEIERANEKSKDRLVLTRRDDGAWQMLEPVNAAADLGLVNTLVQNLRELRKSPDAGAIVGDPTPYGLKSPEATVRVFGREGTTQLAVLEVGKSMKERRYVRPKGAEGIEVVDSRLFSALDSPVVDWRDRTVLRVPSFRVESVSIREPERGIDLKASREERHWRLLRPVAVPADDDKVEGLVAELAALRVVDGEQGFVADDVKDLGPYGLDKPAMTIEVAPFSSTGKPQVLLIGHPVPDRPTEVYALRGDQDDVLRIDVKTLREAIPNVNSLRSKRVVSFVPARVERLRIDSAGKVFEIGRGANAWRLLLPAEGQADSASVQSVLTRLEKLEASEFLDSGQVAEPGRDSPSFRIRLWQREPGSTRPSESAPETSASVEPPRVDLRIGRHDVVRKTLYAQIEGDTTILALPDNFLDVLPKNEFAFRDRTVSTLDPARVRRLTVDRGRGRVSVEAPGSGARGLSWRMVEPVEAAADDQSITALLTTLSNLHAESWESDQVGDGKAFGLDSPRIRVTWTLSSALRAEPGKLGLGSSAPEAPGVAPSGTLRLGRQKPGSLSSYANIEGDPRVFTLGPTLVLPFEGELRNKTVLTLAVKALERIVLRWPTRTLTLVKQVNASGEPDWRPEPGYDASGFEVIKLREMAAGLARLQTPRYLQHTGPIAAEAGFNPPRLAAEFHTASDSRPRVLEIGASLPGVGFAAKTDPGAQGAVFVLPTSEAWEALVKTPRRHDDLPDDVFAK